jgi:hypothetical protein
VKILGYSFVNPLEYFIPIAHEVSNKPATNNINQLIEIP